MDPSDITIEILRGIQAGIVGLRDDVNARFEEHGERLEALEQHAERTNIALEQLQMGQLVTNETLKLISERLLFAEAASGVATDARVRLDDRVDRLEARVDRLEADAQADPPSD